MARSGVDTVQHMRNTRRPGKPKMTWLKDPCKPVVNPKKFVAQDVGYVRPLAITRKHALMQMQKDRELCS